MLFVDILHSEGILVRNTAPTLRVVQPQQNLIILGNIFKYYIKKSDYLKILIPGLRVTKDRIPASNLLESGEPSQRMWINLATARLVSFLAVRAAEN